MPEYYGQIERIERYRITAQSARAAKAMMRKIVNANTEDGRDLDADCLSGEEIVRWELCKTDSVGTPLEAIDGEGTRVELWEVDVFNQPVRRKD